MKHPYQITRVCTAPQFGQHGLLLAACGPKIISVKLEDGSVSSQWPVESAPSTSDVQDTPEEGPPGKKRKLEKPETVLPSVIKLAISPDQLHAVAVTGDDKCIRVFEITHDGSLTELSQRCMPKRPCSILVSPDSTTIVCGDKFGDVYSLPLLPTTSEGSGDQHEAKAEETAPAKVFTPTATNLTVHTARNRRALESQLKQKDLQAKSKEPLKFEHQLLLGHVSMLTDVQIAAHIADGKTRELIITSDRDEHIRISRAPPQAYVIERYCLGHKEFISKLCLLSQRNLFASGGGDSWLGFWNFLSGELLDKCDLKVAIENVVKPNKPEGEANSESKVAISGLWAVQDSEESEELLLAASERTPAIFAVLGSTIGSRKVEAKAIELPGNPLDVTTSGSTIIVSLDSTESISPRLLAYRIRVVDSLPLMEVDEEYNKRLQRANDLTFTLGPSADLLYGIENLRKRGVEEGEDTL